MTKLRHQKYHRIRGDTKGVRSSPESNKQVFNILLQINLNSEFLRVVRVNRPVNMRTLVNVNKTKLWKLSRVLKELRSDFFN